MEYQAHDESIDSKSGTRNWKGLTISLVVIIFICTLIVISIVLKKPIIQKGADLVPFTFEDIIDKHFEPKRFDGTWINNTAFVYLDEYSNIQMFDGDQSMRTILVKNNTIKTLVGDSFRMQVTSNVHVILLSYDMKTLFRYSSLARYKIFNSLSNASFDVHEGGDVQNAVLSPDNRRLAYVFANDIYLMDKFFTAGRGDWTRVTSDGKHGTIYNGITDWLYEEEVLYQSNAIWWSPDSTKFAYLKFNDSLVSHFVFPIYDGSQYDHMSEIRYPKPNTPNPIVRAYVYNAANGDDANSNSSSNVLLAITKTMMSNQNATKLNEYYVWSVKWLTSDSVIVVYVNRKQTHSITLINDATTGEVLLSKEYPPTATITHHAWFVPSIQVLATARYNYYFQIWPYDGYKAIISFDTRNGDAFPVTSHHFDVMDMVHVSEKTGTIYYLATNGDPRAKHLFRKSITNANAPAECLTCSTANRNMTAPWSSHNIGAGTEDMPHEHPTKHMHTFSESGRCLYHAASFSKGDGDYFVLECLGDRVPVTYVRSLVHVAYEYLFEGNFDLWRLVESKRLPLRSYNRVYLDNSTHAYADAEILYPPDFDPAEVIYPVLINVYNGPSSQMVDFQFRIRKFESFLCTKLGVIIALIDGRGTDAKGDKFMKAVSKRLGEFETLDQITLAHSMQKEYYTDDAKFAIWGWSYGGFLSAMALFHERSPFQCAVSGAPVVDWLYYDSAYSERHMGMYDENVKAYQTSNLTEYAIKNSRYLRKKKMLLIHGTGDDNVHFQNSAILAKELRKTKLEFEFEVYPDSQHTPDEETQKHLYKRMTNFLANCFHINYHEAEPPTPEELAAAKKSSDD